MIHILRFLHVIEFIIILPSFVLCFFFYYFSKDEVKADRIVEKWFRPFSWFVSPLIWLAIYFIL